MYEHLFQMNICKTGADTFAEKVTNSKKKTKCQILYYFDFSTYSRHTQNAFLMLNHRDEMFCFFSQPFLRASYFLSYWQIKSVFYDFWNIRCHNIRRVLNILKWWNTGELFLRCFSTFCFIRGFVKITKIVWWSGIQIATLSI